VRPGHSRLDPVDLFVIGGGINGCGIARDAAGRGYSVALSEMGDLASATSSGSTKLFHGGLRYLEFFEFRLVREALKEREVLLRAMPHISWPMRFVLPVHPDMRFESDTPTSRLLGFLMPWMKGRRPAWLIRLGLFLYDHLGGREILPGTRSLDLASVPEGRGLKSHFKRAFEYSDCWVEDSRLVVLNARDAELRGAQVRPHSKVVSARRSDGLWAIETLCALTGDTTTCYARGLVNAAGPWVSDVVNNVTGSNARNRTRLVRGSHIVTRRLFDHEKSYFFQGTDGRIIFAIPYETDFTLIGTTDIEHPDPFEAPVCTPQEQDYLIAFINQYLERPIGAADVVWTYAGVRPLFDDGATSATAATRDYVLKLETDAGAVPLLNVYGGKITTYRKLAEAAMAELDPHFTGKSGAWTAGAALPGGDFAVSDVASLTQRLIHPTDLELSGGTMNVLLGPTLSGKTSLMRLMAGLDRPSTGKVFWNGEDVTGMRVQDRKVAMVYQQFINYPSMTVYENIASPLRSSAQGKAEVDRAVRETAEI
jgi:glycerol-3-phosphate dehydrogenase